MVGLQKFIAKLVVLKADFYNRSYFGNILLEFVDLPHDNY